MRYIFEEKQNNLKLNNNEVSMLFIDFTGRQQLVVCGTDEQLPMCLVKQGTTPVLSM